MHELPFYNELGILKTSKVFKGYARSYNIEITDSKDPSNQFTINKSSTIDLFKFLLDEINSFKYQIRLKYKENTDREFPPVYFN